MLSILIPIYNCNVLPLVLELQKQCLECKIDFEILCQDDASKSILNIENEKINRLKSCSFIENPTNLAHCENRNTLAEKAKFDYLLFIDGDSNIIKTNYIQNYIDNIEDYDVVYGGRLHPEKCPSDSQKLRWKYGRLMEDKSAKNRKKAPFQSLLFNNTVIKKKCFNKVKFDKTMKKYGHDDTLFSYKMMCMQSKIMHIENPVEHNDIDSNLVYINKTKASLENLLELYNDKKIEPNYIKMLRVYRYLEITKVSYLVSQIFLFFQKKIFKNLEGNDPKLFVFNFFRIGYFCSLKK